MITPDQILALIPHQPPFRFVEEILSVDDNAIVGSYRFKEDESFYAGHFPDEPITPGVILIECMAQIGLLGLGIILQHQSGKENPGVFAFTTSEAEFLKPVFPGETVRVEAEKVYFRFGKLKVKVRMYNEEEVLVCKGELTGVGRR